MTNETKVWTVEPLTGGKRHQLTHCSSPLTLCGRLCEFWKVPEQLLLSEVTCRGCLSSSPYRYLAGLRVPRSFTAEFLMICRDQAFDLGYEELSALLYYLARGVHRADRESYIFDNEEHLDQLHGKHIEMYHWGWEELQKRREFREWNVKNSY